MTATDRLAQLVQAQKQTLREMEQEIGALHTRDFLAENDRLKMELEQAAGRCRQAEQACDVQKKELDAMREALHARLYNEKRLALGFASKRLSAYFQAQNAAEGNRLAAFEKTMRTGSIC